MLTTGTQALCSAPVETRARIRKSAVQMTPMRGESPLLRCAGVVLSHAPLMGSDPVIDESHNRWLHIHVRPPVSGMLKARRCTSPVTHSRAAFAPAWLVAGVLGLSLLIAAASGRCLT